MDPSTGNRSGRRICVCGKGGSGKSAIAALLADELARKGRGVIVLDSDASNACLHWMLGSEESPQRQTMK
jgi:CO dehydrogenase maturation factor